MKINAKIISLVLIIVMVFMVLPLNMPISANSPFETTPMISAGGEHTLALKHDGTVWAWGAGADGQIGDGRNVRRVNPTQTINLTDVIAVSAGDEHSFAIKKDGIVWAWGCNASGRLGDGTTTDRNTPVQVTGLSDVIAISGGGGHSLALKKDSTVWTWGMNSSGQLGDGATTNRNTPVQVTGLSDVIAISGGGAHSLALKKDGTVWAWGYNGDGQLGDGTTTDRNIPVQVTGLSDVIAISGGDGHSLALKKNGTVWAWGYNFYGQLGDGTTIDKNIPVQVAGLDNVITFFAGFHHSLAVKKDGTFWVCGENRYGRLGDGTTTNRSTPVQVLNLTGITSVSGGRAHSVAIKDDGSVWSWGYGLYGRLGSGNEQNRSTPGRVKNNDGTDFYLDVPIKFISLNKSETSIPTIPVGSSETLNVIFNPTNTTFKDINWTSSAPTIASVDENGRVTAKAAGKTTITAKTADGLLSASCVVTVYIPTTVTEVAVTPSSVNVARGGSKEFTAVVSGTSNPPQTVNWSVSGGYSAGTGISPDGLLTVAPNETAAILTVIASSTHTPEVFGFSTVVLTNAASSDKYVTSVTTPSGAAIIGTIITANVPNTTTDQLISVTVSFGASWALYENAECSNKINDSTLTLAVGLNTAYIKVTAEDGSFQIYTLNITRADAFAIPVTEISITGGTSITEKGGTLQLTADITPVDATNQAIVWSVEEGAAAMVDAAGLVTAISDGTVRIRATTQDGSGIYGEITIVVTGQADDGERLKGFITNNGNNDSISISDAIVIFRYLAGKTELEGEDFWAADIDDDKKVTIQDAIYIFRYLAGKLTLDEMQEIQFEK